MCKTKVAYSEQQNWNHGRAKFKILSLFCDILLCKVIFFSLEDLEYLIWSLNILVLTELNIL